MVTGIEIIDKKKQKLPPQDTEIEKCILGALMLEKDAINNVVDILKPDYFYDYAHKKIFKAIVDLYDVNSPIDIRTVISRLKKNNELEDVGGVFYIQTLTERVISSSNIKYHALLIFEYALRREIISIASEIQIQAFDETIDVFDLLNNTEKKILSIASNTIKKNYVDIKTILNSTIDDIKSKKKNSSGITGIPSGFKNIDDITSGWQKSDLVIVAARPGMGKTAFLLSLINHASIVNKIPSAIFSLEMSSSQLATRIMSSETGLSNEKIRKGQLEIYDLGQLEIETKKISEAPIFIDDTPSLSISELRTKCVDLKLKHNIQLIVIDYLQLLTTTNEFNKNIFNRTTEISNISRALKSLAKELDVPIIVSSQLSRAVEMREDKHPQLSDLRESGSIEQDADIVLFLYRPSYYGITEDELGNDISDITEIKISKHRNGPIGEAKIKFIGTHVKFIN